MESKGAFRGLRRGTARPRLATRLSFRTSITPFISAPLALAKLTPLLSNSSEFKQTILSPSTVFSALNSCEWTVSEAEPWVAPATVV